MISPTKGGKWKLENLERGERAQFLGGEPHLSLSTPKYRLWRLSAHCHTSSSPIRLMDHHNFAWTHFSTTIFPILIFPNFCIRILCVMIRQSWLQKRCSVKKHFHGWLGLRCCQEQLLRWLWNRWGVKNPTMKPGKKGLLPYYTFKSPTEAFSRENMGVRSWLIFVIFARSNQPGHSRVNATNKGLLSH